MKEMKSKWMRASVYQDGECRGRSSGGNKEQECDYGPIVFGMNLKNKWKYVEDSWIYESGF